jgi:hypothetical protein
MSHFTPKACPNYQFMKIILIYISANSSKIMYVTFYTCSQYWQSHNWLQTVHSKPIFWNFDEKAEHSVHLYPSNEKRFNTGTSNVEIFWKHVNTFISLVIEKSVNFELDPLSVLCALSLRKNRQCIGSKYVTNYRPNYHSAIPVQTPKSKFLLI